MRRKVLVLEDELCVRQSISAFLGSCGLRSIDVGSRDDALAECKAGKFDVAILNLNVDGRRVCAALKERNPETKVVGLSVSVDERVLGRLKSRWGFDVVLSSPCDMDELGDALSKLLA
jgi:CheY-like chemotaxis protein